MAKKKTFRDYTALGSISADWIFKNLAFFIFLGMLTLVYIANTHYSEKKVKEIQQLEAELKRYRWQYMALKSEVMYNTKQSEIARDVKETGLDLNRRKPKKIELK